MAREAGPALDGGRQLTFHYQPTQRVLWFNSNLKDLNLLRLKSLRCGVRFF